MLCSNAMIRYSMQWVIYCVKKKIKASKRTTLDGYHISNHSLRNKLVFSLQQHPLTPGGRKYSRKVMALFSLYKVDMWRNVGLREIC